MPKIIVTSRFISPATPKAHLDYYVRYIATRPGAVPNKNTPVYTTPVADPNAPATEKQKALIQNLVKDFKGAKELFEYQDYMNSPTVRNASELISAVFDRNADIVIGKEAYTHYLGERPGVVRDGEHGLFSYDGAVIDLDEVAGEAANHPGNVWTHVVSLRRSDAELAGYAYPNDGRTSAEAWRALVRRHVLEMAKQTKIKPENLKWYAAYHDKESNPHVHIMMYSKDPTEGFLTNSGIEKIRSAFANDIYSEEMSALNEQQTRMRNALRAEAANAIDKIKQQLQNGTLPGKEELFNNISSLKSQLNTVNGRKVYKFLKPKIKETVDIIAKQLTENEEMQNLYSKWCECQKNRIEIYTSQPVTFPELNDNPEFRTIKNHIVQTVNDMQLIDNTVRLEAQPDDSIGDYELPVYPAEAIPLPSEPSEVEDDFFIPKEPQEADLSQKDNTPVRAEPQKNKSDSGYYSDYRLATQLLQTGNAEDIQKAIQLLERSSAVNSNSMCRLGIIYLYGRHGIERDTEKGLQLLQQASENGNKFAMYQLGKLFETEEKKNIPQAMKLYEAASEHETVRPYSDFRLARLLLQTGNAEDVQKAIQLLEHSSATNSNSMCRLGTIYLYGRHGIERDTEKGLQLLQQASENGNKFAMYQLGKLFETEEKKNIPQAIKLYEAASEHEAVRPYSDFRLARLLLQTGNAEDIHKAIQLLERSSAVNSNSMCRLGTIYLYGRHGIERDVEKGLQLLQQASENGNKFAQEVLDNYSNADAGSMALTAFGLFSHMSRMMTNDSAADLRQFVRHTFEAEEMRKILDKKQAQGQKIE